MIRGVATIAFLLSWLGVIAAAAASLALSSPARGSFAGLIKIAGERRLYVECQGTGSPAVVLEAGLRVRSDYWSHNSANLPAISVFPGVAAFTRVCTYDRPGTVIGSGVKDRSRSDPVPMPRSALSAVTDLHALVHAAGISKPFILAGHSTGGLLVRLYAHEYPSEVAGLVLVDALPDGLDKYMTSAQYALFLQLNTEIPPELASYRSYETIPFGPAFAALRRLEATKPLRPMPLFVLSRGLTAPLPPDVPQGFSQALERAWRIRQAELVKIEPGAKHVVAKRSDHFIMLEQPDIVIRAIKEVWKAVRRRATSL